MRRKPDKLWYQNTLLPLRDLRSESWPPYAAYLVQLVAGDSLAYAGRTAFRATRGFLIFLVAIAVVVLATAIASSMQGSERWVQLFCWAFFALSLVGIAELLSSFISLGESHFRMRKNFRTTVIPREYIKSVAVAKGCPITLLLRDGSKLTVTDLGGQEVDKSLRAWIKAT